MPVKITAFTALWKVIKARLSLEHHMNIGLGMEVDLGKHDASIFNTLSKRCKY